MTKGAGRKSYPRFGVQQGRLCLQAAGVAYVVPVHAGYQGGAADGQPLVERRNQAATLTAQGAYALVAKSSRGQDCGGCVGRTVVHDDKFPIGQGLPEE